MKIRNLLLGALALAGLSAPADALISRRGGDVVTVPAAAVTAGFTQLMFHDSFKSLALNSGGNWSNNYAWLPSAPVDAGHIAFQLGSVIIASPGHDVATTLVSHNRTFNAGGQSLLQGYVEVRARLLGDLVNNQSSFGLIARAKLEDQSALASDNWCSVDIFKATGVANQFRGAVHNWTNGVTPVDAVNANAVQTIAGNPLDGQLHTYGLLWQRGLFTWLFDNTVVMTAAAPPICDAQDMNVFLTADKNPATNSGGSIQVASVHSFTTNPPTRTLFTAAPGGGMGSVGTITVTGPTIASAGTAAQAGSTYKPPTFAYQIASDGPSIAWGVSNLPTWLTASAVTGTVQNSTTPSPVTFSIGGNVASLPAGTYTSTFNVSNLVNGAGNAAVGACIKIAAATVGGSMQVSGGPLSFSGPVGGPFTPASITINVSSSGASLATHITSPGNILNVAPVFSSGTPVAYVFSVNTADSTLQAAGTQTDPITINNDTEGATANVVLSSQVVVTPTGGGNGSMVVAGGPLTFTGPVGGPFSPASITVNVSSTGAQLATHISSPGDILNVAPVAGSTPTAYVFSVNTASASLAATGTANDTITFNDDTETKTFAMAAQVTVGSGGGGGTFTRDPTYQPFTTASLWNTPLGGGATWFAPGSGPNNDLHQGSGGVNMEIWSTPYYVASPSDPTGFVHDNGGAVADFQGPFPTGVQPSNPNPGDLHVVLFSSDHKNLWNWQQMATSDGGRHWTAFLGAVLDTCGDGVNLNGYAFGAGTMRTAEIKSGVIQHEIRYSVGQQQVMPNTWVWPAGGADFCNGSQGGCYTGTGGFKFGMTLGIPAGVDVTALGLSPGGLILAHALQDYGAQARDTQGGTGTLVFYAETGCAADATCNGLVGGMRNDIGTIFAQVRAMSNQSSNGSGAINGGGTPRKAPIPGLIKSVCP